MWSNGPSWLGIPAVVAHQGGWDELLLIAGPIVVVIALLWIAKKRVTEQAESQQANGERRGQGGGAGAEAPPEPPPSADPAPPVGR